MPFVVLRSRSDILMTMADYRQSLGAIRSNYDPQLRERISSVVPELEVDHLRGSLLNLLTTEMMDYLHEGRVRSAGAILGQFDPGGVPIDQVLRNMLRRTIVDGPGATAQAFFDGITRTSCVFSEFLALPRDDIYPIFVRRPGEVLNGIPWVRTLLRVDYAVSPVFLKASKTPTLETDPHSLFNIRLKSTDLQEVEWPTFFQALSMVCQRPVQPLLIWRTFIEPYEIFDLNSLIGTSRVEWNFLPDFQPSAPLMVESDIAELRDLYWGIVSLAPEDRARLQVPIDRWIASVGQRHEVDRMIDLGIAFDSLYLEDDERGSLGDKLADRASRYLGNSRTERQELRGRFKRIYNNRSGAVHRGVLREGLTPEEKEDFIRDAQTLCLQTIKIAIAQGIPHTSKEWETQARI